MATEADIIEAESHKERDGEDSFLTTRQFKITVNENSAEEFKKSEGQLNQDPGNLECLKESEIRQVSCNAQVEDMNGVNSCNFETSEGESFLASPGAPKVADEEPCELEYCQPDEMNQSEISENLKHLQAGQHHEAVEETRREYFEVMEEKNKSAEGENKVQDIPNATENMLQMEYNGEPGLEVEKEENAMNDTELDEYVEVNTDKKIFNKESQLSIQQETRGLDKDKKAASIETKHSDTSSNEVLSVPETTLEQKNEASVHIPDMGIQSVEQGCKGGNIDNFSIADAALLEEEPGKERTSEEINSKAAETSFDLLGGEECLEAIGCREDEVIKKVENDKITYHSTKYGSILTKAPNQDTQTGEKVISKRKDTAYEKLEKKPAIDVLDSSIEAEVATKRKETHTEAPATVYNEKSQDTTESSKQLNSHLAENEVHDKDSSHSLSITDIEDKCSLEVDNPQMPKIYPGTMSELDALEKDMHKKGQQLENMEALAKEATHMEGSISPVISKDNEVDVEKLTREESNTAAIDEGHDSGPLLVSIQDDATKTLNDEENEAEKPNKEIVEESELETAGESIPCERDGGVKRPIDVSLVKQGDGLHEDCTYLDPLETSTEGKEIVETVSSKEAKDDYVNKVKVIENIVNAGSKEEGHEQTTKEDESEEKLDEKLPHFLSGEVVTKPSGYAQGITCTKKKEAIQNIEENSELEKVTKKANVYSSDDTGEKVLKITGAGQETKKEMLKENENVKDHCPDFQDKYACEERTNQDQKFTELEITPSSTYTRKEDMEEHEGSLEEGTIGKVLKGDVNEEENLKKESEKINLVGKAKPEYLEHCLEPNKDQYAKMTTEVSEEDIFADEINKVAIQDSLYVSEVFEEAIGEELLERLPNESKYESTTAVVVTKEAGLKKAEKEKEENVEDKSQKSTINSEVQEDNETKTTGNGISKENKTISEIVDDMQADNYQEFSSVPSIEHDLIEARKIPEEIASRDGPLVGKEGTPFSQLTKEESSLPKEEEPSKLRDVTELGSSDIVKNTTTGEIGNQLDHELHITPEVFETTKASQETIGPNDATNHPLDFTDKKPTEENAILDKSFAVIEAEPLSTKTEKQDLNDHAISEVSSSSNEKETAKEIQRKDAMNLEEEKGDKHLEFEEQIKPTNLIKEKIPETLEGCVERNMDIYTMTATESSENKRCSDECNIILVQDSSFVSEVSSEVIKEPLDKSPKVNDSEPLSATFMSVKTGLQKATQEKEDAKGYDTGPEVKSVESSDIQLQQSIEEISTLHDQVEDVLTVAQESEKKLGDVVDNQLHCKGVHEEVKAASIIIPLKDVQDKDLQDSSAENLMKTEARKDEIPARDKTQHENAKTAFVEPTIEERFLEKADDTKNLKDISKLGTPDAVKEIASDKIQKQRDQELLISPEVISEKTRLESEDVGICNVKEAIQKACQNEMWRLETLEDTQPSIKTLDSIAVGIHMTNQKASLKEIDSHSNSEGIIQGVEVEKAAFQLEADNTKSNEHLTEEVNEEHKKIEESQGIGLQITGEESNMKDLHPSSITDERNYEERESGPGEEKAPNEGSTRITNVCVVVAEEQKDEQEPKMDVDNSCDNNDIAADKEKTAVTKFSETQLLEFDNDSEEKSIDLLRSDSGIIGDMVENSKLNREKKNLNIESINLGTSGTYEMKETNVACHVKDIDETRQSLTMERLASEATTRTNNIEEEYTKVEILDDKNKEDCCSTKTIEDTYLQMEDLKQINVSNTVVDMNCASKIEEEIKEAIVTDIIYNYPNIEAIAEQALHNGKDERFSVQAIFSSISTDQLQVPSSILVLKEQDHENTTVKKIEENKGKEEHEKLKVSEFKHKDAPNKEECRIIIEAHTVEPHEKEEKTRCVDSPSKDKQTIETREATVESSAVVSNKIFSDEVNNKTNDTKSHESHLKETSGEENAPAMTSEVNKAESNELSYKKVKEDSKIENDSNPVPRVEEKVAEIHQKMESEAKENPGEKIDTTFKENQINELPVVDQMESKGQNVEKHVIFATSSSKNKELFLAKDKTLEQIYSYEENNIKEANPENQVLSRELSEENGAQRFEKFYETLPETMQQEKSTHETCKMHTTGEVDHSQNVLTKIITRHKDDPSLLQKEGPSNLKVSALPVEILDADKAKEQIRNAFELVNDSEVIASVRKYEIIHNQIMPPEMSKDQLEVPPFTLLPQKQDQQTIATLKNKDEENAKEVELLDNESTKYSSFTDTAKETSLQNERLGNMEVSDLIMQNMAANETKKEIKDACETVSPSSTQSNDKGMTDKVVTVQKLLEGTLREQVKVPPHILLPSKYEDEATTLTNKIEEEDMKEVKILYDNNGKDYCTMKITEDVFLQKVELKELPVSGIALETFCASKVEEKIKEVSIIETTYSSTKIEAVAEQDLSVEKGEILTDHVLFVSLSTKQLQLPSSALIIKEQEHDNIRVVLEEEKTKEEPEKLKVSKLEQRDGPNEVDEKESETINEVPKVDPHKKEETRYSYSPSENKQTTETRKEFVGDCDFVSQIVQSNEVLINTDDTESNGNHLKDTVRTEENESEMKTKANKAIEIKEVKEDKEVNKDTQTALEIEEKVSKSHQVESETKENQEDKTDLIFESTITENQVKELSEVDELGSLAGKIEKHVMPIINSGENDETVFENTTKQNSPDEKNIKEADLVKQELSTGVSEENYARCSEEANGSPPDTKQQEESFHSTCEKHILTEANNKENIPTQITTDRKNVSPMLQDSIEESTLTDEPTDIKPGNGMWIDTEIKGLETAGEKEMGGSSETNEMSPTMISLSELMHRSMKETIPNSENVIENIEATESKETEQAQVVNDDERGGKLKREAPITVENSGDVNVKVPHKKSHNILSGVSSKFKHSISKVKKVIACTSSHSKALSPKQNNKKPDEPID